MGLSGPCETSGAPRFYEVYGSSARLAFSRYFIVAHVDGFLYVLDKYFCISRLVPARAKRPGTPHAGGLGQQSERSGGLLWDSGLDADRATGEVDGRQAAADQGGGADGGHSFSADGGEADGGSLLVPVRIADVFSALFRNDRPVFSQLLTGSNQYDQRQLQGLRQKSLLLSNRWDGCLYLFLEKFLVRVSLRGTVTVVADLLQLAIAAVGRLHSSGFSGTTSSGTIATGAQPQLMGNDEAPARRGGASPVRRLDSVRRFCRDLGYEEDSCFLSALDGSAPYRASRAPPNGDLATSAQLAGSPASEAAKSHIWQKLRRMQERLQPFGSAHICIDSSSVPERLQEFLSCRGRNWEVNNCCIDGEGRCFYTVAHMKATSPIQQRGMIFCMDTRSPVVRARILHFGRGVSEDAVFSLSLSPHPTSGCILVVAKSASAVRGNILSPAAAPFILSARDSIDASAVEEGESGDRVTPVVPARSGSADRSATAGAQASLAEVSSLQGSAAPGSVSDIPDPMLHRQEGPAALQSVKKGTQPRISDGYPIALTHHDTNDGTTSGTGEACLAAPQGRLFPVGYVNRLETRGSPPQNPRKGPLPKAPDEDPLLGTCLPSARQATLDQPRCATGRVDPPTSVSESLGDPLTTGQGAAARQSTRRQTFEGVGGDGEAEEHSTWWFCPCDEDPTFYFPVAECLHDERLHSAAQSICRQFRGSPSTSVCRAYFGEDGGVAVREGAAAATAACTAELIVSAAAEAAARREREFEFCSHSASPACDAARGIFHTEPALHAAASKALREAALAAGRAESAACSGYILWQPGVKVRRPKTGEEAISFGSAILIRARTTERRHPQGAGWAGGVPPRALESITGEAVAVISQDARHLEVRDALPSPLGFIVVPAEAANRIVKQRPDGTSSKVTTRNSISLTSFLASFVAGSSTAVHDREEAGGAASPGGNTGSDEGRQAVADGPTTDVGAVGATAAGAAFINPTADAVPQKAIPAVNVVFLVDTLRLCRFAEPRPTTAALHMPSHRSDCKQTVSEATRDQRSLGLSEANTARALGRPLFESFGNSPKTEAGPRHSFDSFGDGRIKADSSSLTSVTGGGQRCSCMTGDEFLGVPQAPVLHAQFADVLLLCADGFEIPSHRALLAARCSFFEAKLTRTHWEAHGREKVVIDLCEFPGSVVQAVVRFFETGSFVIPAACCCPRCCNEKRRCGVDQQQVFLQSSLPPYESACCCRVDWVLQAYTFAAYCLLEDLRAELLSVLARLISQRTCLHVLTHPAVRNQQQILHLAAHQLVYHMPMPKLLLEADDARAVDTEMHSPEPKPPAANRQVPSREGATSRDQGRKPLLPLLLSEGVYEVIVTALSAWVLDSRENTLLFSKLQLIRCAQTAAVSLRARQLLILLAFRLLQESIVAPSSCVGRRAGSPSPAPSPYRSSATFRWEYIHAAPKGADAPASTCLSENPWLLVPFGDSSDTMRYFLFRDVVLLWAKALQVPEEDAKIVVQGVEDLCLP